MLHVVRSFNFKLSFSKAAGMQLTARRFNKGSHVRDAL